MHRRLAMLAAAAALLPGPAPAAAPPLLHGTAQLTPAEQDAARALVDDVVSRLPAAWVRDLPAGLRLDWSDALPARVHGRAWDHRVVLRRDLLASSADPDGTTMDAARHALRSALVHELAHVLERRSPRPMARDPRLLDLAGWQVRPVAPGRVGNAFRDRSPDPYELRSPAEFVAVNLEHFVLDPDYACRRPALHAYFAARLGPPTTTAPACDPSRAFVQSSATADSGQALLELDPARVAGVDYLLAEPDRALMSRWGHGMLRLVVCAPGRPPGPECRLDLAHHRVLSFRAFVDDVQISNWKGLTGAYPSRLFVLPMQQVVDEYTRVELRGLRSIPLRLERGEIAALIERASQVHWSYDGRYRFVSNNCAVETWKLLHDAVPRLGAMRIDHLTPTGLLARLQRHGAADGSVLDDPGRALRLGYRFESQGAHFAMLLERARPAIDAPVADVRAWLDRDPHARRSAIERADLPAAAALLVLESAALRRAEQRAIDRLKRGVPRSARKADTPPALRELLALSDRLSRPALLLTGAGYGLPDVEERGQLRAEGERVADEWRARSGDLRALALQAIDPARRDALLAAQANVARLGERLRTMHRAEGGLELH